MNTQNNILFAALLSIGFIGAAGAADSQIKPATLSPTKTAALTPKASTTAAAHSTKSTATVARCNALEQQFDAAKASHVKATKYKQALVSREAGGTECAGGNYHQGVLSLDQALRDIGVRPTSLKS